MLKTQLIIWGVKALMWLIVLGLGIWYLSSSLNGAALTYTSMDNFLTAAGVENGDIASAKGCFMCRYVGDLYHVLGDATEYFWTAMLDHIWILMVIGFGIFLFVYTIEYLYKAANTTTKVDGKDKKLEFQAWFDKVWKQALRLMFAGVFIGAMGMGGTDALKTVSQITITPVMYVGAEFSMAATGVGDASQCYALERTSDESKDLLNPILQPFMCVVGNINSVMLAGAAGGFALMNYSWLDMGGGAITWIAGLVLVLMFLVVGFDLFFQILSVIFKLIFVIIFLPLLLAATAFEGTWKVASGLFSKAIDMVVSSAVRIVAITLKVLIMYATVSYTADTFFPGPYDGYSAMLPPMMGQKVENPDAKTLSVMKVFATCEQVALSDGEMDKEKFVNCFNARRAEVERKYPGAFDFLKDGWDFLLMMACLFFLYYYIISPKIDKLLGKDSKEMFDYGTWVKDLGVKAFKLPGQLTEKITKSIGSN